MPSPSARTAVAHSTEPYPTWLTIIAAVGMLFMVACLVFMVLAIVAILLSSWTISIGIIGHPHSPDSLRGLAAKIEQAHMTI